MKATYPNWVKKIVEEESKNQGKYNTDEYDIGNSNIHVWKVFDWCKSRQGHTTWVNIYYEQDYSGLRQRAKDNGYEYEDIQTIDFATATPKNLVDYSKATISPSTIRETEVMNSQYDIVPGGLSVNLVDGKYDGLLGETYTDHKSNITIPKRFRL